VCVPHQQAAHMAAPTEGQNIKKNLANGEPSTHGHRPMCVCRINRLHTWPHRPKGRTSRKPLPTESRPHMAQSGRWLNDRF
jgi:hypothetical protein